MYSLASGCYGTVHTMNFISVVKPSLSLLLLFSFFPPLLPLLSPLFPHFLLLIFSTPLFPSFSNSFFLASFFSSSFSFLFPFYFSFISPLFYSFSFHYFPSSCHQEMSQLMCEHPLWKDKGEKSIGMATEALERCVLIG